MDIEYLNVSTSWICDKSFDFMQIFENYCLPLPHEYEKNIIPISSCAHDGSV